MMHKILNTFAAVLIAISLTACGSVRHTADWDDDYQPQGKTKIDLGGISNETGKTFNVDIKRMMRDALKEELREENLSWRGGRTPKLVIETKIVEYKKGDAFKRWLLPGWGATVVAVQCDLRMGDDLVGSVEARRTVSMGGGYTIGAWRTIFASIASDVVKELKPKIES